jgi:predicted component of type VI protein secretion system
VIKSGRVRVLYFTRGSWRISKLFSVFSPLESRNRLNVHFYSLFSIHPGTLVSPLSRVSLSAAQPQAAARNRVTERRRRPPAWLPPCPWLHLHRSSTLRRQPCPCVPVVQARPAVVPVSRCRLRPYVAVSLPQRPSHPPPLARSECPCVPGSISIVLVALQVDPAGSQTIHGAYKWIWLWDAS